jgi:hypothetical protein
MARSLPMVFTGTSTGVISDEDFAAHERQLNIEEILDHG